MNFLAKFDATEVMEYLKRATVMMDVPTLYTRLPAHPDFDRCAVETIHGFISGSAPLLSATHEEFAARTSSAILERYGTTEAGMNASSPYDGKRIAGTDGFPLPDAEVRVADTETGEILSQGDSGALEVHGPNVFKGHWRMPERTAREFRADGFFVTSDVGQFDERSCVHIVGQSKDLIITVGFNVYPKEIELAIGALDDVPESAGIKVPLPDFGEGVTAISILQPGAVVSDEAISAGIRCHPAKFKQPEKIMIVPELPCNVMGKVQKNVLRERYSTPFTS